MKRITLLSLVVASGLLLSTGSAWGGGFVLYEFGANGTGRAGANTAVATDATTLFLNPAAITRLSGTQLSLGATLVQPYSMYHPEGSVRGTISGMKFGEAGTPREVQVNDGTHTTAQERGLFYPPHLYVTQKLGKPYALGFSFTTPYGLGVNWPRDWDGRYMIKQVQLQTFVFNPVVAVDLLEAFHRGEEARPDDAWHISLGVGFMAIYGTALLDKNLDLRAATAYWGSDPASPTGMMDPPPPYPDSELGYDGQVRMEGSGTAYSFNVALHIERPKLLALGFQYRHSYTLEFEGDAKFKIPAGLPPALEFLGKKFPDTTGTTSMNMPALYNAGIALLLIPNLVVDLDVRLEDWTDYKELTLHWACNKDANSCGIPETPIPKNWDWNYQISLGAEYRFSNGYALRAGYGHVGTPVPEETYDPILPDGERNLFTFGVGVPLIGDLIAFDFGYMLSMWEGEKTGATKEVTDEAGVTKTVYVNDMGGVDENDAANGRAIGKYSTMSHLFAGTLSAKF